jgi:hypothetical protein
MSFVVPINTIAIWNVRRKSTGSIPVGRGAVLTGTFAPDGVAQIEPPSGADGVISGVTYATDPSDTSDGMMLQAGLSNCQVRLGTAGVTFGDQLNLQDNTGVWQTAPITAVNVYYYALETKGAGLLCWAAPISSRPAI